MDYNNYHFIFFSIFFISLIKEPRVDELCFHHSSFFLFYKEVSIWDIKFNLRSWFSISFRIYYKCRKTIGDNKREKTKRTSWNWSFSHFLLEIIGGIIKEGYFLLEEPPSLIMIIKMINTTRMTRYSNLVSSFIRPLSPLNVINTSLIFSLVKWSIF